jgi:hypothetical protein
MSSDRTLIRDAVIKIAASTATPVRAEVWSGDPKELDEITASKIYVRPLGMRFSQPVTLDGNYRRAFLYELTVVALDATGAPASDTALDLCEKLEEGMMNYRLPVTGVHVGTMRMDNHPGYGQPEFPVESVMGRIGYGQFWVVPDVK